MFDPLRFKTRVALYTIVAFVLGIGGASAMGWASPVPPVIMQMPQVSDAQIQPALDLSAAFVNIAEAVTPAVVRIEADRPATQASARQFSRPMPEEFRQFFDEPNQPPRSEPPPQTAGGSGFIVSTDGYILTNDHVVGDATSIRVFLPDRREYTAELIGTDPTTDVAVIKIDDGDLPVLSLELIGNELRQQGEQNRASFVIEDFIQTDAVINPGNSGGPMVNLRGQVVGINSAIASRTGYYQGYGFAIPIDLARRIMEDLVEFGEVRRAYLGIRMEAVTTIDAEFYGLPRPMGTKIQEAVSGSPSAAAGLRQEDVIVSVNGVEVERPSQLQLLIAQRSPGDEVEIRFYRNREARETSVRLGTSPIGVSAAPAPAPAVSSQDRLGIEVMPLDDTASQRYQYDTPGGLVISGVSPAGPAARAGVREGERLLGVNRQPVDSLGDVESILSGVERGDIVSLRLGQRDGSSRVANIRVPQ
jgi:serine protease Do